MSQLSSAGIGVKSSARFRFRCRGRGLINLAISVLMVLVGVMSGSAFALGSADTEESFLPVDEAFALFVERSSDKITAKWRVAPGYYLYESRMSIKSLDDSITLGEPIFPLHAIEKQDLYFGLQRIYHDAAAMVVVYQAADSLGADSPVRVKVKYQGCAEAGLCYPPQTREFSLLLIQATAAPVAVAARADKAVTPAAVPTTELKNGSESGQLADFLRSSSMLVIVGTFFLLGLGLTFTPCVLPMVPILSSIIAGQKGAMTTARGFALSFSYVMGMAFTYTLLGVLVGFFGAKANVQAWMQQPLVLGVFSVLFLLLALSMFGFYEIQLPSRLRDSLDNISRKQQGGEWLGVTLMGVISALVVSPCVSAPLAGALLYISSTGDAVLGGMALFALSMGMGAPLIAIGSTGAKLLPKAGLWMEKVKQVFGIILVAVALWLMQRVLNETLALVLWSLLFIASGIHVGALKSAINGWQRLGQSIGLMLLLWGGFILTGVAMGKVNLATPLQGFLSALQGSSSILQRSVSVRQGASETKLFTRITSDAELTSLLGDGKPLVLDMYADWCISCQVMDEEIFSQASVRALVTDFRFVQLDVTDFSEEHKAMLDRYALAGPPAVLFFDRHGKEIQQARIAGEAVLGEFLSAVSVATAADVKTNNSAESSQ